MGSLETLKEQLGKGFAGYVDLLAWAEYPGYSRISGTQVSEGERERVIESDRQQCMNWLER